MTIIANNKPLTSRQTACHWPTYPKKAAMAKLGNNKPTGPLAKTAIAAKTGIQKCFAGIRPDGKRRIIAELQARGA
jgi:hypothetical protein